MEQSGLVESRQGVGTVACDPLLSTDNGIVLRALAEAGPRIVDELLEVRSLGWPWPADWPPSGRVPTVWRCWRARLADVPAADGSGGAAGGRAGLLHRPGGDVGEPAAGGDDAVDGGSLRRHRPAVRVGLPPARGGGRPGWRPWSSRYGQARQTRPARPPPTTPPRSGRRLLEAVRSGFAPVSGLAAPVRGSVPGSAPGCLPGAGLERRPGSTDPRPGRPESTPVRDRPLVGRAPPPWESAAGVSFGCGSGGARPHCRTGVPRAGPTGRGRCSGKCRLPSADEHRVDEEVALVDETDVERLRREVRNRRR